MYHPEVGIPTALQDLLTAASLEPRIREPGVLFPSLAHIHCGQARKLDI